MRPEPADAPSEKSRALGRGRRYRGARGDDHGNPSANVWGAIKTIVVADAFMGLDNVLAVAGASKGSFL